jgi:hypothetical protein
MPEKKTMTLNLSEEEMDVLDELSNRYDISKTAVIRKAIRMYAVIDARLRRGDKLFLEDEMAGKKAEILVL